MRNLLRRFIAVVSRLAPAARRREFRAEWDAELATDPSIGRALGAVPDALFLVRQQWSAEMIAQDIRYGARALTRRPAFTAIVILTLAVGIGATTAVFSVVNAVLLRPLPYPDPARLVMVWENDRLNGKPRYPAAPANYFDWESASRSFEHLAGYVESGGRLSSGGEPFHANVTFTTTNFFAALGVQPLLGRTFTSDEGIPPRDKVLVLSHTAWQTHFGSDPAVVGRTVQLDETAYRVVGVMPRGFAYPSRELDGWRPWGRTPDMERTRARHFVSVIGRVKAGTPLEAAHDDLESIAVSAQRAYPATNDQRGTTMTTLAEAIEGDARRPMYLLLGAVGLLLLIAVVNVANLMLVESTARRREMAVRSALGADRLRLLRQLVVEGLLLALSGGALGVALALQGTRWLAKVAADYVPRIAEVHLDARVLAFAAAVSMAAGVLAALAPGLAASRVDVQHDLREGGRGTIGRTRRVRGALVFVEFAAAVVIVIGAALVLKSFWRLVRVEPGFATASVLTADIGLPSRYQDDPIITQFYVQLLERVRAIPGVNAAGVVNNLPVSGNGWTAWFVIERAPRPAGEPPEVGYRTASPGYFATLQIPVIEGRGLADSDTAKTQPVLVINRALADRFFPGASAIGRRVRIGPGGDKAPWLTIVGVVGNVRHAGPEEPAAPEVFMPTAQEVNGNMTLAVRTNGDPTAIAQSVRAVARSIDPAVTMWRVRTIDDVLSEHLAPRRLSMYLIAGFGAIALGLALLGIYGVMSYTVSERVPEIGVRLALGAEPAGILRMVVGNGLALALPGLAAGTLIAVAATRLARALLFDVSPTDPAIFASVCLATVCVAALACYLPARRAAHVDPLRAIRAE
jgi:putative ABC transport system permease protein